MKRFTAADAQSHAVTPDTSAVKALEQGAIAEKRRAFVQDWLANRGRSISLLSAGGLIFLPLLGATSAQAQQGPVLVSTLDGVSSMAFNPDGSLQLALSNGQFVTIAAAEVTVMANGAVAISAAAAELVASLAGIGAAGLGTGALAALGGGVAAAAAAAGGGGGGSDAGSSSPSSPPPPVRGASFDSNPDSPLAVNAGMVLSAQNFVGIAPAGSIVQITLNDANGDPLLDGFGNPLILVPYQGIADSEGEYEIDIPFDTLNLSDGDYQIVIQAFNDDGTGNPTGNPRGTQTVTITVDTAAPTLDSIDTPIAVNGEINIADSQNDLVITGTSSGAEDGAEVIVTLNGVAHSGTVTADTWSVTIPASALQNLPDGPVPIAVEVFDLARNSATGSASVDVDLTPPTISITALPFGDFLNFDDTGTAQTVDGTSGGANGRTVTLTVTDANGAVTTFTETTDAATGAWSIDLPTGTLAALAEGAATLSATVTDSFNNPPASPATALFTKDSIAPDVAITQIAGDGIINIPEQADGFTVSGTSNAEEGQLVTVLIDGVAAANTGAVDANGNWTVTILTADVAGLGNGDTPAFTARVQDQAGNETTSAAVPATVNLTEPTIAVTQIGGDGFININELTVDGITVTGTTDAEVGRDVDVTLTQGGITATTTVQVQAGGTFTAPFTPAQLAGFTDGVITASATVENAIGNTGTSAGLPGTVDLIAPTITINEPGFLNAVAGDTFLNNTEASVTQTITGTAPGAEGQLVTVTVTDGTTSITLTDTADGTAPGTWSVDLTPLQMDSLDESAVTISAMVSDAAGNPADNAAALTFTKDTNAPDVAITQIAGDDIINIPEQAGGFTVSGTTNAEEGQLVTVLIDGVAAANTGAVDASGNWTVTILTADVTDLGNSDAPAFTARVQDQAGNETTSAAVPATVNLTEPTIAVTQIGGDGYINLAEQSEDGITVTGTTDAEDGQGVVVTLTQGGTTATTTVQAGGGTFTAPFTPAQLADFTNGAITATATVENAIGNTGTSAGFDGTVDLIAPTIAINDPLAGNNQFTKLNEANGLDVTGTTDAEDGQIVTVTYNGNDYPSDPVAGGIWTATIPNTAFAGVDTGDTITGITARVSDQAGNPSDAATGPTLSVDLTGPSISINAIAGDDIINIAERADLNGVEISGIASGADNQTVTVVIRDASNDVVFDATDTAASGTGAWSVTILQGATWLANDATFTISADVSDFEGIAAPTSTRGFTTDFNNPTIDIGALPFGSFLNALDTESEQTVSGTSSGANGQTVTLTVTDADSVVHTFTGDTNAATGAWSIPIPTDILEDLAEGTATLSATVNSAANNPPLAPATATFTVDTEAPDITINEPPFLSGGDTFLNFTEASVTQTITGTAPGAEGQLVTVTVTDGTTTITLTDTADGTAPGNWSVDLIPAQMDTLDQGQITISAMVSDAAGNPANAPAELTFTKDTIAPNVTITQIAGDNIINIPEQADGFTVSGTTDVSEAGRTVTVTITGVVGGTGTGTVQPDGSWTANMPDGLALGNGTTPEFTASVTDAANNTGTSAPATANVNLTPPTISFATLAGDDSLNIAESNVAELTISGTTTGFADNDQITISATGISDITLTVTGNTFTHDIARADVFALIEAATGAEPTFDGSGNLISAGAGDITFTASGTNDIGNPSGNVTTDLTLALTPPELAIGDIEGTGGTDLDGVINIDERAAGLEINGTSNADGQTVTVTLTDGNGFTAIATGTVTGGTWQADFAAGSLDTLPDGTTQISVTAEVTDVNGNGTTTAPTTMPADFIAPDVTIASVESGGTAIGDFINIDERDAGITVEGGSDLPEGTTVTVTLTAGLFVATATGITAANGDWSAVFEGDGGAYDLEDLPEGAVSIVASADDAAGNTGESAPVTPTADLTRPDIFIDPIGDEGVVDRSVDLIITGTTDAEVDQEVTIIFNGTPYTGDVVDGAPGLNTFEITIPALALEPVTIGDAVSVTASVSDIAGNGAESLAADFATYAAAITYITEIERNGSEIRIAYTLDPRYDIGTDDVALADRAFFDGQATYLPTFPIPSLGSQPEYSNAPAPAFQNPPSSADIAAGEPLFFAVWIDASGAGNPAIFDTSVPLIQFSLELADVNQVFILDSIYSPGGGATPVPQQAIIGTDGNDTLTAPNIDATIRGRGGNDTIDMSAGGVNTVIFEADPAANGLDTITGFSSLNTALPDRIGFAGLDNSTLRGAGTDFQALGAGGTLGTDTGFVVLTFDLTGLTAGDLATAAEELVGEAGGDFIYLLATDGTNAALARVEYTAPDTASAEIMANFTGLGDLTGITANEILGFNTV
ncbi:beta strand repeat-containing protein [Roseinatronobacter sp.]